MSDKSFIDKIQDIQQEYVAAKTENNEFGGYAYRNIEKMLISLKPLLKKHGLLITFSDKVHNYGDRYYVEARAKITDGSDSIEASAFAREELEKKKSDASQLTGSASTYARKYALSGLLGVDDGSNDPDSKDNDRKHYVKPATSQMKFATEKQIKWIRDTAHEVNDQLGDDEETDAWIESILTIKPSQVPIYKVLDAVNKIKGDQVNPNEPLSTDGINVTDQDLQDLADGKLNY